MVIKRWACILGLTAVSTSLLGSRDASAFKIGYRGIPLALARKRAGSWRTGPWRTG